MKLRTWLRPGMFIKRWILLLTCGVVTTSLGLAMGLAWIYRNYDFPHRVSGFVQTVTLQFIPHPYRELLMVSLGGVMTVVGFWQLSRSLLAPFLDHRADRRGLAEIIHAHRFGPEAPEFRVVAIGGGTGLSTLLRGLKAHNVAITAIVTTGDDGGSSGRLRQDFNIPPPGDIRNCLVALADAEPLMSDLFQYRFPEVGSSLDGHSFGNLFIAAMTQITGSFERAVAESSRVLAVRGQVMPSTLDDITVCAEFSDGRIVHGESAIARERGRIRRVFLDPDRPTAYEPALLAILSADLIVLGPGSLYTSVIPNLLVDGVIQALRLSSALKVFVCNVTTQRGETDGYRAVDHLEALRRHGAEGIVDCMLVNENLEPTRRLAAHGVTGVSLDGLDRVAASVTVVLRDVVNRDQPWRHDSTKLAAALLELARAASRGEIPVGRDRTPQPTVGGRARSVPLGMSGE
ncbi:MAG: YvcK family protein [Thermomicrobium sp.]|nr:YvcK family protein [Thermomicrobium sp.]